MLNETDIRELMANDEGESIEFKPGVIGRDELAEYAVGIGNAGGGWLVMGVTDRQPRSVVGIAVPSEREIARIRESVADSAGIHIQIHVVQTTDGPVLAARIPARPKGVPFHTKSGKYLTRLGERLRGLTPAEIDSIRCEAGSELTARPVPQSASTLLSAAGLEELRTLMREAGAAEDLPRLPDEDLLRALGVLDGEGRLLIAGLLLVGKPDAIRQHLPSARWQFRRMRSDTEYDQADDGADCLPVALRRLRQLVDANNPIVTIPGWLVHPEFPRYPRLALRELLVNALAHRDYELTGTVVLKLYRDRFELSNPGGFLGGITPSNILHHPSTPRYPTLFHALTRMRLANSANLGVPRVFKELLAEGKEPPAYWASGSAVRVTIAGQDARREFLSLVEKNPGLDVDHLLVIHYLTRHREITTRTASEICHRPVATAREVLADLVNRWRLLETGGGSGSGRYYRLSRAAYDPLGGALQYHIDQRLALENARARVLMVLDERPLSNAEVREITQLSRYMSLRLMNALRAEGLVELRGEKRGSRWHVRRERGK